jgi:hypothetical protein
VDVELVERVVGTLTKAAHQSTKIKNLALQTFPHKANISVNTITHIIPSPSSTNTKGNLQKGGSGKPLMDFVLPFFLYETDDTNDGPEIHILGPYAQNHANVCKNTYFAMLRTVLGLKDGEISNGLHCTVCAAV